MAADTHTWKQLLLKIVDEQRRPKPALQIIQFYSSKRRQHPEMDDASTPSKAARVSR